MKRERWTKRGVAALSPQAVGDFFLVLDTAPATTVHGDVAVVRVQGPLTHHREGWWDSYDAIRGRVESALSTKGIRSLVIAFDSPGGDVSGLFETAAAIRAACDAASVALHAHVDGCAASAAYALACVAQTITVPTTGVVGSIGCVSTIYDVTKMNAEFGINVRVIASGARKTDGNPDVAITDEAEAAEQAHVNELAEVFFEHVAARRPQLDVAKLRALQAGVVVTGKSAVREGLADRIDTLDGLIASLATPTSAPRAQEGQDGMTNEEQARASLQAMLDDAALSDEDKARAQLALDALDGKGGTSSSTDEETSAQLAATTAANAALTQEIAALRSSQPSAAEQRETAACAAVDEAIAEGRISATSRETWLTSARASLSVFKKQMATLPALTKRVTANASSKGAPTPKPIEDEEAEANRLAKKLLEQGGHKSAAARIG